MGEDKVLGLDSFGGQDGNFACLPDYHFTKCHSRKLGLFGDNPSAIRYVCELTAKSGDSGKGFVYDQCNIYCDDYRECPIYRGVQSIKGTLDCIEEVKGLLKSCEETDKEGARQEELKRHLKFIEEGFFGG